jgi:flavin reductase (DIM6/NTAB) family NADH-FMN oxidoreductase RutF
MRCIETVPKERCMHYDPEKNDHNLARSPFKSCVVPRPIGWISTVSAAGIDNLAPYSQFQNLGFDPAYVMIAANQLEPGKRKDTVVNIEETGEFVYNMATYDLREAVNRSAMETPPDVDEFIIAGVTKAPSICVKPVRVAESPIQFECVHYQTLRLPGRNGQGSADIVIGRVVLIHIKDEYILHDGRVDILKIRPLARLGYYDYTTVDSTFEMLIPESSDQLMGGLEGDARRTRK